MGHRKRATKAELSRILGVSHTSLSKFQHDPTFPEFDRSDEAEIYEVIVWWYLRKESNPVSPDEEIERGPNSPALERLRTAKAQQEEIKLDDMREKVMMKDDFDPVAAAVFPPWRRISEHALRTDNREYQQMIDEANAEVLANLERLYGCNNTSQQTELD